MTSLPSARRILCLWFPDWPIQRRMAAQPELERSLFLLIESNRRGEFVRYCNRLAERRGISVGMPVSEARTLVKSRDHLVCEPVHPEQDRQDLMQLAVLAEKFSFCVGLEETECPESLLMDVTRITHLFGGELSLAQQIRHWLADRRYTGRIAIAGTVGMAWGAAHCLDPSGQPFLIPPDQPTVLDFLPVAGLRLAEATISRLHRLGLKTIASLRPLDRAAVIRRFGSNLLLRLDQFTGQHPEFITPCRPQPRYCVEQRLEDGVTQPEAIEYLFSLLLRQLLDQLQPWGLGLRHLHCHLQLEDRTSQSLDLRVCQATNDPQHVDDLLRFHRERLELNAPVIGLMLEALDVGSVESAQREFFEGESRDQARQFSMLLNRLTSRLGEEAVVTPRLLPDPVPERAIQLCPVTHAAPAPATAFASHFHGLDRPPVLFSKPRSMEAVVLAPQGSPTVMRWKTRRYEIARTWGPERIESGWWQDQYARRDYYRVATTTGQRLWVFQRLQDKQWFWHGEW